MRPIGPGAPIRSLGFPRSSLTGGTSDRSGRWPSRVWITKCPHRRAVSSTARQGSIAAGKRRYVIAERFAEAPRLEEVALHVDDDERGPLEVDQEGSGCGVDRDQRHSVGSAGAMVGGLAASPLRTKSDISKGAAEQRRRCAGSSE